MGRAIAPHAFSMEHVAPALCGKNCTSAPADFKVWGRNDEVGPPSVFFGRFKYEMGPETDLAQSYDVLPTEQREYVRYVTLEVLSNHGNADYTCLYRFRVHGEPDTGG